MYEKSVADCKYINGEYEAAAEMFLEGARDGDAQAAFNYAHCLLYGKGVNKDPTEAKSFFAFARDLPGGAASYNLAMLYFFGNGVEKDYKRAYSYLVDSAADGCLEAKLYLGMAHTSGCMFDPDIIGINMIPAHEPIYRDMTYVLDGDISEEDLLRDEDERYSAVKQDANRAFDYFQAAARHKDATYVEDLAAKGKFLYARCFVDGLGTDIDIQKAARLMVLAGKSGSKDAVMYLAERGISEEMLMGKSARKLGGK